MLYEQAAGQLRAERYHSCEQHLQNVRSVTQNLYITAGQLIQASL